MCAVYGRCYIKWLVMIGRICLGAVLAKLKTNLPLIGTYGAKVVLASYQVKLHTKALRQMQPHTPKLHGTSSVGNK